MTDQCSAGAIAPRLLQPTVVRVAGDSWMDVPDARGTYLLVLHGERNASLQVGRNRVLDMAPGWYVYVGSALGPGGLRARLRHHCLPVPRPHWHLDYLRAGASVAGIGYVVSAERREHDWAEVLRRIPGAMMPMVGFGASDCVCASHLYHFGERSRVGTFVEALRGEKGCAGLQCLGMCSGVQ